MFNILTAGSALSKIHGEMKIFFKNIPEIEKARKEGDWEKEKEIIRLGTGKFARNVTKKLGIEIEVEGRENIPEDGPMLVVSNHQGYADILAIFYALQSIQVGFIAKDECKKIKPLANGIIYTSSLFIKRGGAKEAVQTLKDATELMKTGHSLAIFPEGTRSRKSASGKFKPGSFKFAGRAGVPILPITIIHSYKIYEEKNRMQKGKIKVIIHPLVEYQNMTRSEQVEAQHKIEETIINAL